MYAQYNYLKEPYYICIKKKKRQENISNNHLGYLWVAEL